MNNLKRVLSLGLAGTMLSSMMVAGASAKDFTDADKIEHSEAVNVLVALGIIDGKPDGSFDPTGDVARGEMAKMIAVAMNGGNDANTGVKTNPTFSDIKGHWAESYIEYCADLGIISGRGDGTFDPNGNVTGLEATKMVLSAMGFDATAYKLTGSSWAVRTDEVARTQTGKTVVNGNTYNDPKMYEDLSGVMMANACSRDTAAQLIWNGLQNRTRTVQPTTNTNTGSVEWTYVTNETSLLKQRYEAEVTTGIFNGNYHTGDAQNKGEVNVGNRQFPYELDINEIGEEFKVIWKDGKDSKNNSLDRKDVIFGAFNTHKTEVYHTTMNDIQGAGASNLADNKIKFGGTLYEVASTGVNYVYNFDSTRQGGNWANAAAVQGALKNQEIDTIKFVVKDSTDADNGKIYKAYVTNYNIGRVTSVSSEKVTIQGVGTIDKDENTIYDGIAVDDVVVFTRFYDNSDKDKAVFTVEKAETVEGKMTGFKNDGAYKNIVVDGETYKVETPATSLRGNLTEDDITALTDTVNSTSGAAAIGDTIRLYMMGDMVGCVQLVVGEGGKYAIVTEVNDGAVGSVMDPLRATVMFADGSEQTLLVHKDSTFDNTGKKFKDVANASQPGLFAYAEGNGNNKTQGDLIEYTSVDDGYIKIKRIANKMGQNGVVTNSLVWDEDAKTLNYKTNQTAVAAAESTMFIGVNNKNGNATADHVNDWYAYDMRSMGDVKNVYYNSGTVYNTVNNQTIVQYFLNDKNLVAAAAAFRNSRPGSTTEDTLYGIVTGYQGTRQNSAKEDMWVYTVAVGRDEDVTIAVKAVGDALSSGELVMFNERADGEYVKGEDLLVIVTSDDTVANDVSMASMMPAGSGFALAAIREYNAAKGVISYYANTIDTDATTDVLFNNGTTYSYTVDKDVAVYYVDADDNEQGDDIGVTLYDVTTGYANAILHYNDKKVVDAIIIETSGKANLAKNSAGANEYTTAFGTPVG